MIFQILLMIYQLKSLVNEVLLKRIKAHGDLQFQVLMDLMEDLYQVYEDIHIFLRGYLHTFYDPYPSEIDCNLKFLTSIKSKFFDFPLKFIYCFDREFRNLNFSSLLICENEKGNFYLFYLETLRLFKIFSI